MYNFFIIVSELSPYRNSASVVFHSLRIITRCTHFNTFLNYNVHLALYFWDTWSEFVSVVHFGILSLNCIVDLKLYFVVAWQRSWKMQVILEAVYFRCAILLRHVVLNRSPALCTLTEVWFGFLRASVCFGERCHIIENPCTFRVWLSVWF